MTKEDRRHRSHELNPRKWPIGPNQYNTLSNEKLWNQLKHSEVLLSLSEQQFIQDVPRHLQSGYYANLGHAMGGSACLLASGLREYELTGKVYSIDLKWEPESEAVLKRLNLQDFVEKCEGSTDEWAEKLIGLTFNFVFIDADHCYEAVVKDFWNWSPKIRIGGWVSFHDTNQDFSNKAVADTVAKNKNWIERKDLHIHRIRTFERNK